MATYSYGRDKSYGKSYGIDISEPAKNAKEAVQFTYFGYLAAIKETTVCYVIR